MSYRTNEKCDPEALALPCMNAPQVDEARVADLAHALGLGTLATRIMVARGITTVQDAEVFLNPNLERDWLAPELIPGLLDVADKVESVIRSGGRILVFGDFDVDGITATTISVRGLKALGADVHGLIPHRYEEGYALSEAAVMRGMEMNPDLIMTVDCGISCGKEVEWMLEQGMDVCITDHHEPADLVPQGVPVADPKLDPENPCRDLAGCAVALKLLDVLGKRFGQPDLWKDLTDFAALGTIADLMPLNPENRALVAHGVQRMNMHPRVCIDALGAISNVAPGEITSTKMSFSFIPRLNAAGRMGDATVGLDLLLSDEVEDANRLAAALDAVNKERREVEAQLAKQVEEVVEANFDGEAVIVAAGEGWHEGVKGIVASRIARKYHRPAIVLTVEDGVARGSGRTYGQVNLFEVMGGISDMFDKFGGHTAAVGVTLSADKVDEMRSALDKALSDVVDSAGMSDIDVDVFAKLSECTVDSFQELDRLHPFGNTNPVPRIGLKNVFMDRRSAVGKTGNHLRYQATDGADNVAGIWFGVEDIERMIACESPCDIAFEASVDEWQGRFTAKLMTKDVIVHDLGAPIPEDDPTEGLLARQAEFTDTGDYAGITEADSFHTKVVGVTFENRQEVLVDLEAGVELKLVRQPDNEFDPNAIAVTLYDGTQLGYLNRALSARLACAIDAGQGYDAAVTEVTGGPSKLHANEDVRKPGPLGVRDPGVVDRSFGVNIIVRKADAEIAPQASPEELRLQLGQTKAQWKTVPDAELDDEIRKALIGDHQLHDAQANTLAHLAQGESTLAIMATGRGKSLIFHMHAARTALKAGKAAVFIYPLRALVADQAFHLQETYGKFGLGVQVLTGETEPEARERIYADLAEGYTDVILTTPEFLSIHAQRFRETNRIGFVVVDEAHHVGQAKAGNRPAYAGLSSTLEALGNPLVLAVTATAGQDEAATICRVLGIKRLVLDPTVRENLHIDDRRDLRSRENYLASVVASGAKCIAYVNSRDQSMTLTRMLRHRLPTLAPRIAFYNAGLPKADRKRIENAFRTGELMCIVSTSAFGEGIDIPDVEHVVLYHLPFNDIEFNQMSGRAGRDGRDAQIHLLYGYGDSRINEKILASGAPPREKMVALYRALRAAAKQAAEQGNDGFSITNQELADAANKLDGRAGLDDSTVSCGISVFRELGFLETSGHSVARYIRMVEGPEKMQLEDSVRYREGVEELEVFNQFRQWALSSSSDELLARFNRPILPSDPDALLGTSGSGF